MEHLLETAKTAAVAAGEAIMELYDTTEFETKGDGSPVTIADKQSHEVLLKHLSQTDIPVLSEESAGISLPYPERLWIIDPLDGTKDFIHKTNDFAVMIGLVENGVPVLGIVYAPTSRTLYFARKGIGAFKEIDGHTTLLKVQQGDRRLGIRSRTHHTPEAAAAMAKLGAEEVICGGVGIKAMRICESAGDFFFYPNAPLGEWDVCAPAIILEEAGGTATDQHGNPLAFGTKDHTIEHGAVFSNGSYHKEIIEAIA